MLRDWKCCGSKWILQQLWTGDSQFEIYEFGWIWDDFGVPHFRNPVSRKAREFCGVRCAQCASCNRPRQLFCPAQVRQWLLKRSFLVQKWENPRPKRIQKAPEGHELSLRIHGNPRKSRAFTSFYIIDQDKICWSGHVTGVSHQAELKFFLDPQLPPGDKKLLKPAMPKWIDHEVENGQ